MAIGTSRKQVSSTPAPSASAAASSIVSIIGRGMVLEGDCTADGPLRIEGHVKGNVRASHLVISAGGRVDGNVTGMDGNAPDRATIIEGHVGGSVRARRVEVAASGSVGSGLTAHEAIVHGHVKGPITTESRLVLEETATVEGDVTARRLGLKEGGKVFGTIRIGEPRGDAGIGSGPGPRADAGLRGDASTREAAPSRGNAAS